ncbi:MAG: TIGR02147 family protein [Chitinispirillaceae bacterium]
MANSSAISVFDYTDYRCYLADYYHQQKLASKVFSYRYFAKKASINSVGLYKDVVEGRQSLGKALVFKFSAAIGHNKREAEYFQNMVFFNEAGSAEERKLFFERMRSFYGSRARVVKATHYEFYHKWYYSAVRMLIAIGRFSSTAADYRRIAKTLNPRIRPEEAQKAVRVLERLQLIRKEPDGFFAVNDSTISTGTLKPDKSLSILNVVNFQKEMSALANDSLDRFGIENINLSTLTLGISESTMTSIRQELSSVRKRIAELAENDSRPNRVFQLNMQFFPLSDVHEGDR